jgi:hypothetical protein
MLAFSREFHGVPVRMYRGDGPLSQVRAGRIGQPPNGEALSLSEAERGSDSQRAVDEIGIGRDELDRDPIRSRFAKREGGLEPGDSGTGDQYLRSLLHPVMIAHRLGRDIRTSPER